MLEIAHKAGVEIIWRSMRAFDHQCKALGAFVNTMVQEEAPEPQHEHRADVLW